MQIQRTTIDRSLFDSFTKACWERFQIQRFLKGSKHRGMSSLAFKVVSNVNNNHHSTGRTNQSLLSPHFDFLRTDLGDSTSTMSLLIPFTTTLRPAVGDTAGAKA